MRPYQKRPGSEETYEIGKLHKENLKHMYMKGKYKLSKNT